ncbi:hypothetical protein evm_004596 [Chilo suppressalis]|nr:hypothetical protein evm_004596 [Chilo suppressalis]
MPYASFYHWGSEKKVCETPSCPLQPALELADVNRAIKNQTILLHRHPTRTMRTAVPLVRAERAVLLIDISPRINGSFEEASIISRQKLIDLYWSEFTWKY